MGELKNDKTKEVLRFSRRTGCEDNFNSDDLDGPNKAAQQAISSNLKSIILLSCVTYQAVCSKSRERNLSSFQHNEKEAKNFPIKSKTLPR